MGVKVGVVSREEHRWRVCESGVVRGIFDVKGRHVSCSMHIVKKKGIQSLLIKPEHEKPLVRLGRIIISQC